jgi:hypothetical protein
VSTGDLGIPDQCDVSLRQASNGQSITRERLDLLGAGVVTPDQEWEASPLGL